MGQDASIREGYVPMSTTQIPPRVYPCLLVGLLLLMCVPIIPFLLPGYDSQLGENYQPLRALKFFHSRGGEFHKYGPLPNFVLAPVYGSSIAYWKVTGQFESVSSDFPYGLKNPLEQLTALIVMGRVLFLIISIGSFVYLLSALKLVARNHAAAFLAMFFCVATNSLILGSLPCTRPDGLMLSCAAISLAVYLRIIYIGWTPWRAFWLSIFAVCAMSSKELAGPMYVLPYLGLGWVAWRRSRLSSAATDASCSPPRAMTCFWIAIVTGLISYAILNVVYAPQTWLARMEFWLAGPGKDSAVWGRAADSGAISAWAYPRQIVNALMNNLGPAGLLLTLVAVAGFAIKRPTNAVFLWLPFLSVSIIGLLPMGYVEDRFYTIAALSLVLPMAAGLDAVFELARSKQRQRWLAGAVVLCAAVNLVFSTFVWHQLDRGYNVALEQHVQNHVGRESETIAIAQLHPHIPGKSRLESLGYTLDPRTVQQLAEDRTALPEWFYMSASIYIFLEETRQLGARAEYLQQDAGFDINQWPGPEKLGYRQVDVIIPQTPAWFFFDRLPLVTNWQEGGTLLVYRKKTIER